MSDHRSVYYLVVDLEATCSKHFRDFSRDECETIEIGAVMVDSMSWEYCEEFCAFVKPVRHPILTEFCIALTGIVQQNVDNAEGFPCVFEEFTAKVSRYLPYRFCSWGPFDKEQFLRDCQYHNVAAMNGFDPNNHIDLSALYRRKFHRRRSHRGAMKTLGLVPTGHHHRGLDDARNIIKMLPHLVGDKT